MFRLVSDESSQKLGIDIHKKRSYSFETTFLTGMAEHDSTTKNFTVVLGPNYQSMAEIAQERENGSLSLEFNHLRPHSIILGEYPTLDVADAAVAALDHWYREVLKRTGANHRFLVEEGNNYQLAPNENASDIRYGDAVIRARNVQAFNMMRQNKNLDHPTMVGKIMPIFLHALGLREYHLSHDTSDHGNGGVSFIIERVGIFSFFKPQKDGGPAYFERYSYSNGKYFLNFSGQTKGDVVRKFVFEWLADAAREQNIVLRDDFETHLDELAQDIRRTWISQDPAHTPTLIEAKPALIRSINVVSMAAFRHS